MRQLLIAALAIWFLPVFALAEDITIDVTGALKEAHVFKGQDAILIGRDDTNHIRLSSPFVSRSHAKITCFSAPCLLTDLRSTNGTTLNGKPVPYGRNATLQTGDVIGVADYRLTFLLP